MTPTLKDMINAHAVIAELSTNPNLYVSTSFKFLPVLDYLVDIVDTYLTAKDLVVEGEGTPEEKEVLLLKLLAKEVNIPDVQISVSQIRSCGLTMIDVRHIQWWLVERVPDAEFED